MSIPQKSSLRKFINWTFITLFVCIVITCNLSNHVDAFKCDVVNGSDGHPGWSNTKEEAVKRTTYVCDVKLPGEIYKLSKAKKLSIISGWIERSWRGGFWYLTTNKDTGVDAYYHVVLLCKKSGSDTSDWTIINSQKSVNFGYIQLQDFKSQFSGGIDTLPRSDTLRYTVLKRDTIDFHPNNIDGTLVLVLQRHNGLH